MCDLCDFCGFLKIMPSYLTKLEQRKTYLEINRHHIHKSYLKCSSLWINQRCGKLRITPKPLKSSWISIRRGGIHLHFWFLWFLSAGLSVAFSPDGLFLFLAFSFWACHSISELLYAYNMFYFWKLTFDLCFLIDAREVGILLSTNFIALKDYFCKSPQDSESSIGTNVTMI